MVWNQALVEALASPDKDPTQIGPTWPARAVGMVNVAMYDAAMGVLRTHKPFRVDRPAPGGASAEAAAAAAAHHVLVELYPLQKGSFDAVLEETLATLLDDDARADGVAYGIEIARRVLDWRADDGSDDIPSYIPTDLPGHWRPMPTQFIDAIAPQWGAVMPFGIPSAEQFRAPAPPALNSSEYTAAYNEVKELGSADSLTRTEEQEQIGDFWAYDRGNLGTPLALYQKVTMHIAEQQGNTFAENARLFAMVSIGQADSAIAAWETKYHYDIWRPITAINEGDSDGNPDTIGDPDWQPLGAPAGDGTRFTPPFPAYVSGHATFGAAVFEGLANFYGADDIAFTLASEEMPGVVRSFTSFSQASAENARSRIYLGIHWNFDDQQGQVMGRAIADFLAANFFTSLDGPSVSAALRNDTGFSDLDGLTRDPSVTGRVSAEGVVTALQVAVDSDAPDAFVDVTATLGAGGTFDLDRAALETALGAPLAGGEHTLFLKASEGAQTSETFTLTFTLDTSAPAKVLNFTEDDGTAVTITIKGEGRGGLEFGEAEEGEAGPVLLVADTDGKSSIKVTIKGGDGRALLSGIHVAGPLKSFTGKTTDFEGAVTFAEGVDKVVLGDVSTDAVLTIGSLGNLLVPVTLQLGQSRNLGVVSDRPFKTITATDWGSPDQVSEQIVAPWIGKLTIKGNTKAGVPGNFEAGLDLEGGAGAPAMLLGSASIKGLVRGVWAIDGAAGKVTAGALSETFRAAVAGQWAGVTIKGAAAGLLAAAGIKALSIGGDANGLRVLAGADLGDDAAVGGDPGSDEADVYSAGGIAKVTIKGAANALVLHAGFDPVNGAFEDGDDILIPGGFITTLTVGGQLSDDSEIVAAILPSKATAAKRKLTVGNDARFGAAADRFPVRINSVSPFDGETMVSPAREVTVRFNDEVDSATLTSAAFRVTAAGVPVPGRIVVSATERFASFFYDDPLPAATAVRVEINGSLIQGRDGLPVDADGDGTPGGTFVSDFSTQPLMRLPGTNIFGFVRDAYSGEPIAGATIRVDAFPEANAVTDANGRFELTDMPAPAFFVHIDGSTATNAPPGFSYPSVGKPFHSVPGQTVQLSKNGMMIFDVFLPPVAVEDVVPLSSTETTDVSFGDAGLAQLEVMFPEIDPAVWSRTKVKIAPGTAVDVEGNAATQAVVLPVPPDRIPAPLPSNLNPRLVISVQPLGATRFDTPAPVSFPNLEGLAPGEKAYIFTFNHDAGRWDVDGTGTVSDDGLMIESDPGVGLLNPGWHLTVPGSLCMGMSCGENCVLIPGLPRGDVSRIDVHGLVADSSKQDMANFRELTIVGDTGTVINDPAFNNGRSFAQSGVFFFLPKITSPSTGMNNNGAGPNGEARVKFDFYDEDGNKEERIGTIRLDVVGGYSGSGVSAVTSATDKLSILRLTQRLAYLGFPNADGSALQPTDQITAAATVANAKATWAIGLFNNVVGDVSLNNNNALPATALSALGLQFANALNAPRWLTTLPTGGPGWTNVNFGGLHKAGTSWTVEIMNAAGGKSSTDQTLTVNQVSLVAGGNTNKHSDHETGNQIDLESPGKETSIGANGLPNEPFDPFFLIRNIILTEDGFPANTALQLVAASATDPTQIWVPINVAPPDIPFVADTAEPEVNHPDFNLDDALFVTDFWDDREKTLELREFNLIFDGNPASGGPYVLDRMRSQLDAFRNITTPSGVTTQFIIYNDPRLWGDNLDGTGAGNNGQGGFVRFSEGHYGHYHVDLNTPAPVPAPALGPQATASASVSAAAEGLTAQDSISTVKGFGSDPRIYYRFDFSDGFVVANRGDVNGNIQEFLRPKADFTLTIYEATTNRSAVYTGTTNASGETTPLGPLVLSDFGGPDADDDGIPDVGERAIGTNAQAADTDNDGIRDDAELNQGLNPLDGRAFPTGAVGATAIQGGASSLVADGDLIYTAGISGLSIVDVTDFDNPVLLGRFAAGGPASDVGVDGQLRLAAIAGGPNLRVVNVSDPLAPSLHYEKPLATSRVEVADGLLYAAAGDQLHVLDLLTGQSIQVLNVPGGGPIEALAREGSILYAIANNTLSTIDISLEGDALVLDSLAVPLFGNPGLFVGNGIAWIASAGLFTVDATDPTTLVLRSDADQNLPAQRIALNGSGLGLVVAGGNVVDAYDVTDPLDTDAFLFQAGLPGGAADVAISRGVAYAATNTGVVAVNYLPFDNAGVAPTLNASPRFVDADSQTPGVQVVEGTRLSFDIDVADDVQVASVELLLNGDVIASDVAFPWDLSVLAPALSTGVVDLTLQVRATDTGGNPTLSSPIQVDLIPDTGRPTLARIDPADGAVFGQVLARRSVRLVFSEPMNPKTLTRENVRLTGPNGQTIELSDIQLRADGRVAQFTYPVFAPGQHTVDINAPAITDLAGNTLGDAAIRTTFSVNADVIAPQVVSLNPADGASLLADSLPRTMQVVFSEALDPATVNAQTFRLQRGATQLTPESVDLSEDGRTVLLTYAVFGSGVHTFTIDTQAVRDLAGNPIGGANQISTFNVSVETIRPTLVSATPIDLSVARPGTQRVRLVFSEPMDADSMDADGVVLTRDGVGVPLSAVQLIGDGSTAEFRFDNLPAGNYSLNINPGAMRDVAGNSASTPSSTQRFKLVPQLFPLEYATVGAIPDTLEVVDIDGDGELDVFSVNSGQNSTNRLTWLFGDGQGGFRDKLPIAGSGLGAVRLVDINHDNIPDLVAGSAGQNQIGVRLGVGGGSFGAQTNITVPDSTFLVTLEVADLNNDGDLDIFLGNSINFTTLLGNGDGTFQAPQTGNTGQDSFERQNQRFAVGDLNGDNLPDLVIASTSVSTIIGVGSVMLGNGDGTFGARADFDIPNHTAKILLFDANGDDKLDLLSSAAFPAVLSIRLGDGQGAFSGGGDIGLTESRDGLAVGDFNGDNTPDVVSFANDRNVVVTLVNPNGTFGQQILTPLGAQAFAGTVGDLNGDDKLDLVVAGFGQINVEDVLLPLLGNGDGTFQRPADVPFDNANASRLVDVDGDDDLDAVVVLGVGVGDGDPGHVAILRNTGDGTFEDPEFIEPDAINARDLAVADVSGDGVPDILTAHTDQFAVGGLMSVMIADGAGGYLPRVVYSIGDGIPGIVVADLDGDGDRDAVLSRNYPGFAEVPFEIGVFFNQGDGTFGAVVPVPIGNGRSSRVAVADLTGDGRPEIVVGQEFGPLMTVLINNGNGGFAPGTTPTNAFSPSSILLADGDGDGLVDMFASDSNGLVRLFTGNGDGTFESPLQFLPSQDLATLQLTDMDGDGILDLVGNTSIGFAILFGGGGGVYHRPVYFETASPSGVSVGDLNGDGAPDLIASGPFDGLSIRFSL